MSVAVTSADEVQLQWEENAHLRTQIAWLKKQLFGPGESETPDRAQLRLALEELEKRLAPARPVETITYKRSPGRGPKRPLPAENFAHLPIKENVVVEPAAVQSDPSL